MKIRQIKYKPFVFNSTLWNIICSLNPKAQAVNKAQRQLRPEPYFPDVFKLWAQYYLKIVLNAIKQLEYYYY